MAGSGGGLVANSRLVRPPRPHMPSAAELAAHAAFLTQLSEPLWLSG
jgi:DNA polymerase-3 subunit epsilon